MSHYIHHFHPSRDAAGAAAMEESDEGESDAEEETDEGMRTVGELEPIEEDLGLHDSREASFWEKLEEVIKDPKTYLENGHAGVKE